MIYIFLFAIAILTGLSLIGPFLKKGNTPPRRGILSVSLLAFVAFSLTIYSLIGQPDLTKPNALQTSEPARGPSAEDIKAAQQMSPEEREQMILSMVDSLAARLEENPDNPAGWSRLLRARRILGQESQRAKDIETIRTLFSDRPHIRNQILDSE